MNLQIKLVVFTVDEGKLHIYLPNKSLPGGKIKPKTSLDISVDNILRSAKLSTEAGYIEQLYTISTDNNTLIVAYYMLMPYYAVLERNNKKYWLLYKDIKNTKSPDYPIISYALQRLCWKIEYTNAVYSLLPKQFTLSELQIVYEAILGKQLDKRNFRKKILFLNILKSTGQKKSLGKARPAEIYEFAQRQLTFVNIL